jgi:hypothetical protein
MAQDNSQMSEDTKAIIVILLLLFVYPIGLILMWAWMKSWPTWLKIIISLPIILIPIFMIMFAGVLVSIFSRMPADRGTYNTPTSGYMMSAAPSATTQLPEEQKKQMLLAAQAYVKKNSVPDMQFDLDLKKVVSPYALLQVTPLNQQIDPAQVVMKYENDKWVAVTMGTDFPELQQQIPQLFN